MCVCIYVDPSENNSAITQVYKCEDCPHPEKHSQKTQDQDIATLIFAPLDTKTVQNEKVGKGRPVSPGKIAKKLVLG